MGGSLHRLTRAPDLVQSNADNVGAWWHPREGLSWNDHNRKTNNNRADQGIQVHGQSAGEGEARRGGMTKDYRIEVRVKNARLYNAMKSNGIETVAALSRASGVDPSIVGAFMNLKIQALRKDGRGFKANVLRLSETLRTLPEDLFPPEQLENKAKKNFFSLNVTSADVEQIVLQKGDFPFMDRLPDVINAIKKLPDRTQVVLVNRYGINGERPKTLAECGGLIGVSRERTRQIEHKGLRQVRKRLSKQLTAA